MAMMQLRSCSPVKLHFCDCAPSVRPGSRRVLPSPSQRGAAQAHAQAVPRRTHNRCTRPSRQSAEPPGTRSVASLCSSPTRPRPPLSHHDIGSDPPCTQFIAPSRGPVSALPPVPECCCCCMPAAPSSCGAAPACWALAVRCLPLRPTPPDSVVGMRIPKSPRDLRSWRCAALWVCPLP